MVHRRSAVAVAAALMGADALVIGGRHPAHLRSGIVTMQADPTDNPFTSFVNGLQEAIQTSPAAALKKGLAKMQAGEYDQPAVKAKLDSLLSTPCVVFSFTTWPFCVKAKQLLDSCGARYEAVELNEVPDGYALRAELAELTGRTSVPAVFVGGEFVGGCNDGGLGGVVTLQKDGRLQQMLTKVGALA